MIHVQGRNNLKAEQAQSFCTQHPIFYVKIAATGKKTFEDFTTLQSYKNQGAGGAHVFFLEEEQPIELSLVSTCSLSKHREDDPTAIIPKMTNLLNY